MHYEIKNSHSTAPAEIITQTQYDLLKSQNRLAGFEVKKVEDAPKPAELTKAAKAEKDNKSE